MTEKENYNRVAKKYERKIRLLKEHYHLELEAIDDIIIELDKISDKDDKAKTLVSGLGQFLMARITNCAKNTSTLTKMTLNFRKYIITLTKGEK